MKRFLLILLLATLCAAQTSTSRKYFVFRKVTSATVNRVTISATTRALQFDGAWVKCSLACTLLLTKNGTVTGGSAGTIVGMDERAPTVTATATVDGTLGSTTTVLTDDLAASGEKTLSGSGLFLTTSSNRRFSLETTSSSGTHWMLLQFSEP